MADDLDKFVLQYTVELRDSVARLEKLNQKVEGIAKSSKKTGAEIKDFAADATGEIGKLIPGLDKASVAIRALGSGFAVAGVAVGALAIGIKAVMDMREQYNAQRKEGMDIGVSTLRLEEYQRKFVKESGGHITREQTAEEVKKISQFSSAVFRDPTRIGTEARTAKVLGLDMGEPGQHRSVNALMTQLGEKFSKMTDDQVQASAKTLGMNQDFALSLKKQGAGVGKVTELKPEEIENRKVAQDSLDKFNIEFAKLKEQFTQAENILGERLLPALTSFIGLLTKIVNAIPSVDAKVTKSVSAWDLIATPGAPAKAASEGAMSLFNKLFQGAISFGGGDKEAEKPKAAAAIASAKAAAKSSENAAKKIDEMVDGENDINAKSKLLADQQALAINQFAGAVASFSNAVDEKQAWAAWAGEIGRASGLNKQPTSGTQAAQTKATAYDDMFKEAGAKHGIDPDLLKKIARIESNFNPKATSSVGAKGLMQIMPANFKELGVKDAEDPMQNIMGGAKLLATYMKKAKGNVERALLMYHGGYDESGWGEKTRAYPGKVLGQEGGGETRSKINLKSVQNTIAQRLGVPVDQLQQGGVNRGDVSFANSQIQSGIVNNINDMKNQLKAVNLPAQTRSKMMTELREQQTGLAMMRQYGGQAVDKAQPGERSITIGERAIVINVNAAEDPAATAEHVKTQLSDHFGEIVNGTSTGMKY